MSESQEKGTTLTVEKALAIIAKHRRHVELSPGAGESHQRYALATLGDVESDVRCAALRVPADRTETHE